MKNFIFDVDGTPDQHTLRMYMPAMIDVRLGMTLTRQKRPNA